MWNCLRGSRLDGHKFRRQAIIGDRIVDFLCPSKGLIVEIDGDTHDPATDAAADRDMLAELGFKTVRYSNLDVMQNMEGLLEDLRRILNTTPDRWAREQSTTPRPPPLKRRGSAGEAVRTATDLLATISDSPRLDAELLMAHALGVSRSDMLLRAMRDPAPDSFDALVARRAGHEPVAYITGSTEFYGLELQVSPSVLIPRGDSEALIDAACEHFVDRAPPQRILDLGTGSGALLLAALSLWPQAEGVAIDASMSALRQAHCNATKLGMAERCTFLRRSWRTGGWQRDLGRFDLVLCNPPYVEDDATLDPQVREFEPSSALFAGPEGLDDYEILLPQTGDLLSEDGIAIFEIGATQQNVLADLVTKHELESAFRNDLAGLPRAMIILAKKHGGVGKAAGRR